MTSVLKIAVGEIGLKKKELTYRKRQVIAYSEEAGVNGLSTDPVKWASGFVNWVVYKAKFQGSGLPNSLSWLKVGTIVNENPEPEDIVIFGGDSQSAYVAIFLWYSKDRSKVFCVGARQDSYPDVIALPTNKVLGFRRLLPIQNNDSAPIHKNNESINV